MEYYCTMKKILILDEDDKIADVELHEFDIVLAPDSDSNFVSDYICLHGPNMESGQKVQYFGITERDN